MSKKYYYLNESGQQMPPVDFEALKNVGLRPDTYVWYEGLDDWKPSSTLPELSEIIAAIPPTPPVNVAFENTPNPPEAPHPYDAPSSYLWLGILTTILCCLPFGIVSIIYACKVDSRWLMGDYDEAYSASRKARNWGIASAVTSIVLIIIYVIAIIATAESELSNFHRNY